MYNQAESNSLISVPTAFQIPSSEVQFGRNQLTVGLISVALVALVVSKESLAFLSGHFRDSREKVVQMTKAVIAEKLKQKTT